MPGTTYSARATPIDTDRSAPVRRVAPPMATQGTLRRALPPIASTTMLGTTRPMKPMEPLTPEPDFRNHANQGSYTDEHKTYHLKHAIDDALRLGIATDNAVDVDESES